MKRTTSIFALLVGCIMLSTGCATAFAKRAMRSVLDCEDRRVAVADVSEDENTVSWFGGCENSIASYRCIALSEPESDSYDVSCEYLPICSNDGHYETLAGTVER